MKVTQCENSIPRYQARSWIEARGSMLWFLKLMPMLGEGASRATYFEPRPPFPGDPCRAAGGKNIPILLLLFPCRCATSAWAVIELFNCVGPKGFLLSRAAWLRFQRDYAR
jgi:hypothetical protein